MNITSSLAMLREHFVASVGVPNKPPDTSVIKDAAIFVHEFQPLAAQRAVFKKSATPKNCLAISDEHVFAAQAGKAVVHVYDRVKGSQLATIPFTERISSISLACDASVLILGTEEGRLFLWETCTGRVITASQTHLKAITSLVVDPTSTFLLTGSKDSTVQVWSIPDLLSPYSQSFRPLRTFDLHRSEVKTLALGHSWTFANFAISTAEDRTCLIWDYHKNLLLRTFLLSGIPSSLVLDPADRAAFIGHEDGNIQMLDLFTSPAGNFDAVQNGQDATVPIQLAATSIWKIPDQSHGSALSIGVSHDGTTVLSGHESGSILNWDVARGAFVSLQNPTPLPGPVNDLVFLPVTGFINDDLQKQLHVQQCQVVKPKPGAFDFQNSQSSNYAINARQIDRLGSNKTSCFDQQSPQPLDEALWELTTWNKTSQIPEEPSADFMALDGDPHDALQSSLKDENENLKMQIESLRRVQIASLQKVNKLIEEKNALMEREQKRMTNGQNSDDSSDVDIHLQP